MTEGIIDSCKNDAIKVIKEIFKREGKITEFEAITTIEAYCNAMKATVRKLNKHHTRHKGQNFTAVSLRALIGDDDRK
jgi:hypothetical protein